MEQPTLSHRVAGEGDPLCTPPQEARSAKRPWSTPQVTSHAGQQTGSALFETAQVENKIGPYSVGASV